MAKRCKACGGVYDQLGSDGVPYYHVCPPITLVAVQRDGTAQRVPLPELRPTDSVRVQRGADRVTTTVAAQQRDDHRIGDSLAERPNKRDERPRRRVKNGRVISEPTADGDGVDDVAIAEPTPEDVFADKPPSLG